MTKPTKPTRLPRRKEPVALTVRKPDLAVCQHAIVQTMNGKRYCAQCGQRL